MDNKVTNYVEDNMDFFSCELEYNVAAQIQHNEAIYHEDFRVDLGCFNPKFAGLQYDMGIDFGITRRQVETNYASVNCMDSSENHALVKTLNCKQKLFFDHVLHKVKTNDLSFYTFLTGGACAGVGKGLLTTCLFQAMTRFFTKQVANNFDNVKYVCVHQPEKQHIT